MLQFESALMYRPRNQLRGGMAVNTEYDSEREIASAAAEAQARESGRPGGGAGRTDTPGHTGVYPLSASESASGEALVHSEPAWGQGERGAVGYEDSGASGILPSAPLPSSPQQENQGQRNLPALAPSEYSQHDTP